MSHASRAQQKFFTENHIQEQMERRERRKIEQRAAEEEVKK
jgi:hypothetical protein